MKKFHLIPIVDKKENESISKVLSGYIFAHGPNIQKFEENFAKFTKAPYAISVSSCTAGMHLIYFSLKLKKEMKLLFHLKLMLQQPTQSTYWG